MKIKFALESRLTAFFLRYLKSYIRTFKKPFAGAKLIRLAERLGALEKYSQLILVNGKTIQVDKVGALCRENWLFGGFEEYEQKFIIDNFKNLNCCFDVGANCGLYSSLFLDVISPHGKVYAFEPNSNLSSVIKANCFFNTSLIIEPLAIGSEDGHISFNFMQDTSLSYPVGDDGTTKVQQTSLDSYVLKNSIASVDLIKIDVEGGELKVINGMSHILRNMNPVLLIEITSTDSLTAIERIMQGLSYTRQQPESFKKWNYIYSRDRSL